MFAFAGPRGRLLVVHYRLALLGFLGLTIVGVVFQFYPPGVERIPAAGSALYAGQSVGLAQSVSPAGEVVAAIVTEATETINDLSDLL